MADIGTLQADRVIGIFHMARVCLLVGASFYILALLADGKFLWLGIIGIFLARLPEGASAEDHRRVRNNRIKWLLALPYFMNISLGRMKREHLMMAREKNIRFGIGYHVTVVWHVFWLLVLGIGYLFLYLGIGAFIWGLIWRVAG